MWEWSYRLKAKGKVVAKRNKTNQPVAPPRKDEAWEQLRVWLSQAQPKRKNWETLCRELRAEVARVLGEGAPKQHVRYFARAIKELLAQTPAAESQAESGALHLALGKAYEAYGEAKHALAAFQAALSHSEGREQQLDKAEALRWIGHLRANQNQWREAAQAYEESLQVCVRAGEVSAAAHAQNSLAILRFEQGELEQAAQDWESALEQAEQAQDTALVGMIYNNLGALANVQGRREQALAYYLDSIPYLEKHGEMRTLAGTYQNLGMTHADAARWAEAGKSYEKGARLAQQLGDVPLQTLIKLNRVELYLGLEDVPVAESLCRQVLQSYTQLNDRLGQADAHKFLGVIHARQKAWKPAQTHFEKSVRLARKFQSPLCEAEARFEYGRMLKQKGAAKTAHKHLQQALVLFTQLNAAAEIEKVKQELAG